MSCNVDYLTLPQQVKKNKEDISKIKTDTAKKVYHSGDTLPKPEIDECHNYLIGYVIAADDGPLEDRIGGLLLSNPTIVSVCNYYGDIFVYPGALIPSNLVFTSDYRTLTRF